MFKPGDYCNKQNVLIIEEIHWEDIKKRLDDENFSLDYSWVYDAEKEDFKFKSTTQKLYTVMKSNGTLKEIWMNKNESG